MSLTQVHAIQRILSSFDEGGGRISQHGVPQLLHALGRDAHTSHKIAKTLAGAAGNDGGSDAGSNAVSFDSLVQAIADYEAAETMRQRSPRLRGPSPRPKEADSAGEEPVSGETSPENKPTGDSDGGAAERLLTPISLIERLAQYRLECQQYGDYAEAQRAARRSAQIRESELARQNTLVSDAQRREVRQLHVAQERQFVAFCAAWDVYVSESESVAFAELERLKSEQTQELQALRAKPSSAGGGGGGGGGASHSWSSAAGAPLPSRLAATPPTGAPVGAGAPAAGFRGSRRLIELRMRETALAKLGRYDEALQVKMAADRLYAEENASNADKHNSKLERLEAALRKQHANRTQAVLKRIRRERGEQLRLRSSDCAILLQRNKNIVVDLERKHRAELQKATDVIQAVLDNPGRGKTLLKKLWGEAAAADRAETAATAAASRAEASDGSSPAALLDRVASH